jgi:hypothetical protein
MIFTLYFRETGQKKIGQSVDWEDKPKRATASVFFWTDAAGRKALSRKQGAKKTARQLPAGTEQRGL